MNKYSKKQIRENRIKWLKALISRNYKQGIGRLRKGNNFCCLGVACSVSKLGKWSNNVYYVNTFPNDSGINEEVRNWLGMSYNENSLAVSFNDTKKLSFREIAKEFAKKWHISWKVIEK